MKILIKKIFYTFKKLWTYFYFLINCKRKSIFLEKGAIFFKSKFKVKKDNEIIIGNDSQIIRTKLLIKGTNNVVYVSNDTKIYDSNILIKGDNNRVVIGEKVQLVNLQLIIEHCGNELTIGAKTTSSGLIEMYIKEGKKVIIGEDCMLSRDIIIRTSDGHSIVNDRNKRINYSDSVIIKDRVWIGQRAMLMKGAKISDNTVIAAGSTVTKKFENENIIIAGNPAKQVRENISWSRKLL